MTCSKYPEKEPLLWVVQVLTGQTAGGEPKGVPRDRQDPPHPLPTAFTQEGRS